MMMKNKEEKEQKEEQQEEEQESVEEFDETIVKTIDKVDEQPAKRTFILFLKGPHLGKLYALEKRTNVIGRTASADIAIKDNSVSRKHVEIKVEGEEAIIKDLGSTNGTFVNNKRIIKQALQDGDKIQISPATVFKFILSDESEKVFHDELYKMGVMDPVTNIYNKRYFAERLKQEFSHANRNKTELSLLMIDIDFFKKVNDTYGHLAGDFVLAKLSEILSRLTREEDIVARYGGEEFVAILAGASEEGATICAERIRDKTSKSPLMFEGKEIKITISIGVVTLSEENPFETIEELIETADNCLYYSKARGRNCTTCLSEIKA